MRELTVNTEHTELFGNLAADDEVSSFFRNCFYATKTFEKLKRKKRLMILVGEKGTGKTALFRMAAMENDASADTFAVEAQYLEIDEKLGISQKIQCWKDYLGKKIAEKLQGEAASDRKRSGKIKKGLALLERTFGNAVKEKCGFDYMQLKTDILSLLSEGCKIRLYIDNLDVGYRSTHEKNETIIALFTAVREMLRDMENLSCRIALRTDVYDNVRREDESSDKIKDAKMNLVVTNHEIITMLTKRVMCYLDSEHVKKDYSVMHQSLMLEEMASVFDTTFHGRGKWDGKPMYNVLMSFVRRRPRDIISLCGLAWDHAVDRGATKISTEDIEAVIDAYSKECRSDILAEYGQEFQNTDALNHLLGALRPSSKEQKKEKMFVYTRDELIKKIDNILGHENFYFSDGRRATSFDIAAFLYRANVVVARKDAPDGSNIERIYYMEKPDLIAGGTDCGYQFEIHPAYRGAIASGINVMNTIDAETARF